MIVYGLTFLYNQLSYFTRRLLIEVTTAALHYPLAVVITKIVFHYFTKETLSLNKDKMSVDASQTRPVGELVKISLAAALYVAVTLVLAVVSFGAIQIRLSEMFNYLALFHKRYVWGVTLGVIIANFMSPTWVLDVPFGSTATFLALLISRAIAKRIKSLVAKMAVMTVMFMISMSMIAIQLVILLDLPFFLTWFTSAISELISMTIGGAIIYMLSKKVDLSK